MAGLPDPEVTLAIWIGAFGNVLVKKGIITKDEIIAELEDKKSRLPPGNAASAGVIAEIDNMISTVKRW